MTEIISFGNFRIKEVVKLRQRATRDETGLTIVEGLRETRRAFDAGIVCQDVYCSQCFFDQNKEDSFVVELMERVENIFCVKDKVFEKICFGNRNEGILVVCKQPQYKFSDLKLSKNPLVIVLESLEKPGNLGAILRTCDGAGVEAIIVCDQVTDIYNPNVVRSSTGVIFSIPIVRTTSQEAVQFLKEKKISICATFLESEKKYTQIDMNKPIAIVAGSEQRGLDNFWRQAADDFVFIPMVGQADSLNVSVATSIVLYEAVRQRNK